MITGSSSVVPVSVEGDGVDDEVNLRGFLPAGGPIILQLLEMPPQAKSINNWTIRKGTKLALVVKGHSVHRSHTW